jgi:hypothetical protein
MATDNLPDLPSATIGLERFAAAWVERWLANGGSIAIDHDGRSFIFAIDSASDVPGYQAPPADWPESLRLNRLEFDNYMHCGRTRELMDLLESVVGGRAAVKDHVRRYPSRFYADGGRELA